MLWRLVVWSGCGDGVVAVLRDVRAVILADGIDDLVPA
jgi:hypothetical protein